VESVIMATGDSDFELVYFVLGYYDQPRDGIADFKGTLHRFACSFDQALDDYPEIYLLRPIGREALLLELEAHQLYFRHGPCPEMSHPQGKSMPAFPEAKPRYDAIQEKLKDDRYDFAGSVRVRPVFRRRAAPRDWNGRQLWEVKWELQS
jgi:hypothetical protein